MPTLQETAIHKTPFWILAATVRDNRKRIVELVEERGLHLDHDACQKARGDLVNPRNRLSAEMAWLPGMSPKKAKEAAEALLNNPAFAREAQGLPALAKANLMASSFDAMNGSEDPDNMASFILELAHVADDLNPEEILRQINEDRSVSGFPEIPGCETIEAELSNRLESYRRTIRDALNKMPSDKLVKTMTKTAVEATNDGESDAPRLFNELVDTYQAEAQEFLSKEAENIVALVNKALEVSSRGEEAVGQVVDRIEKLARNWVQVAQPIQISMKPRGIVHKPSRNLSGEIRGLGVALYNEHKMIGVASRITSLLAELFAELSEVAETLKEDSEYLSNVAIREAEAEEEKSRWEGEIAYEGHVGLVFKDTLKISIAGVEWKNKRYPLESITRVRWGGIRQSVNGIPTGTDYTIAFGDNSSEAIFKTKKEAIFSTFTDKLWKAVCARLMTDILKALRGGEKLTFGDAVVDDRGVGLIERHTFSADKPIYCLWKDVKVWNASGSYFMGLKGDAERTYASASYINDANTHLIEHLVRLNFKGSDERLSDALN